MKFKCLRKFTLGGYHFSPHPKGEHVLYYIKNPKNKMVEAIQHLEAKGFLTTKLTAEDKKLQVIELETGPVVKV